MVTTDKVTLTEKVGIDMVTTDMGVYKIKNLKVSEYTDKLFVTEYDKEGYILRRYWIRREDLIECEDNASQDAQYVENIEDKPVSEGI